MDQPGTSIDTSEAVLLYDVKDGIATLTFNRPERMNGWTGEVQREYLSRLQQAGEDDSVKVIVVTGAGKAFCAGADMDMLQSDATDQGQEMSTRDGALTHMYPTKVPKPIIAAINGACAGVGFVHALMCDMRFAARGARFSAAFSRRGLVAEHGTSWLLPRMIGMHQAFDLLVSSRKFDATEAHHLGLLNAVSDPDSLLDDVYAYAADLVQNVSPTAMAAIKYQMYRHLELGFESSLHETFGLLQRALQRSDVAEGSASFIEKRAPVFEKLTDFRSI